MYDVWLNEVKKRWLMNDAAIFFFLFSTNYLLDVGEAFKLFLIKVKFILAKTGLTNFEFYFESFLIPSPHNNKTTAIGPLSEPKTLCGPIAEQERL